MPDLATLGRIDRAAVERVIDRSLARLRRERLDLVQFHWWDYAVPGAAECAQHLAGLQAQGKIDRIGVTNFDHRHLAEIAASGVDVVSAQVQYSLLDRRPEGGFAHWAGANDVAILAYGSLAGGFLTDRWLGESDPGFAFDNRSLVKYRLIIEEFGGMGACSRTSSGSCAASPTGAAPTSRPSRSGPCSTPRESRRSSSVRATPIGCATPFGSSPSSSTRTIGAPSARCRPAPADLPARSTAWNATGTARTAGS